MYHEVSDAPIDSDYNVSPADFLAQMQALKASGVDIVTVKQALDALLPQVSYDVFASAPGGHGTATPASQSVTCESNATVTITPDPGWHVASITDNAATVSGPYGSTYVINNVTEDHDVIVAFESSSVPLAVTSISPSSTSPLTIMLGVEITGSGFQAGAAVKLEMGERYMQGVGVNVVSDTVITCNVPFFMATSGAYDVVVTNPGGEEARLTGGFTVTSTCGQGSGTALLLLGLMMGLLSLAGSSRRRRKA
jgi:hypothetical protein